MQSVPEPRHIDSAPDHGAHDTGHRSASAARSRAAVAAYSKTLAEWRGRLAKELSSCCNGRGWEIHWRRQQLEGQGRDLRGHIQALKRRSAPACVAASG